MNSLDLHNKKIAVVGLGARTGVALVEYLCKTGAKVTAYDQKPAEKLKSVLNDLKNYTFDVQLGIEEPVGLNQMDMVLISPGVPIQKSFLTQAKNHGVPVWSELEFSARNLSGPIAAITGTNGKSTTTVLLSEMLISWGKTVFSGGNLGNPLVRAIGQDFDFAVVEISSFQLEAVDLFHPKVAILLNISSNHLDRHGDMDTYVRCKQNIFANMSSSDFAVLNMNDDLCMDIGRRLDGVPVLYFSSSDTEADISFDGKNAILPNGSLVSLEHRQLPGVHNIENYLAAIAGAHLLGCPNDAIKEGIEKFQGLPHRLECVYQHKGVSYINDSKSTTPLATIKAIESLDGPLVLLLGGRSKGADMSQLEQVISERVRSVILFGEAAEALEKSISKPTTVTAQSLDEAVTLAIELSKPGDTVLFSPGHSSFDSFRDYEERGERFSARLKELLCA